ncbi:MAG TPA: DUF4132 domain-containing protein [Candidatus Acidoferrales bacterium]
MSESEKQARIIYELMCSASAELSPSESYAVLSGKAVEAQAENPAFTLLREAENAVRSAFLGHSFEWLRANSSGGDGYKIALEFSRAIAVCLRLETTVLPADVLLKVVSDYRKDYSLARYFFAFEFLLPHLEKAVMSGELRAELREIHLQMAPSPTGKIQPQDKKIRDRIAELIRVEGERELEPGRGPWSQIVFDEIAGASPAAKTGWETLLEHCRSLAQPAPAAKWQRRTSELIAALGSPEVTRRLHAWLGLGPTPGRPSGARSPAEDSAYQKGVVWCLAGMRESTAAAAIADFGIACLRKVPRLGAVSQKVGLACVKSLGEMGSPESMSQLTRLRAKVKYTSARKLIEQALRRTAQKMGVSADDLEDMAAEPHGLDRSGTAAIGIGDVQATIRLEASGRATVVWQDAAQKILKAPPASVKNAFPKEVRAVGVRRKALEQALRAQKSRLESSLISAREMTVEHWRRHFIEHPLLGFLGRRLIWNFRDQRSRTELAAVWLDETLQDSKQAPVSAADFTHARLWHPLAGGEGEVARWREIIFARLIHQPFPQAFREFYQPTDGERETRQYSNRFAGVLMRQHQFASLCREREWTYRLQGPHFNGENATPKICRPGACKPSSWSICLPNGIQSCRNPRSANTPVPGSLFLSVPIRSGSIASAANSRSMKCRPSFIRRSCAMSISSPAFAR